MDTAGHNDPEVKAGFGACPDESDDRVSDAPLPAVEGAAKGSAMAATKKKEENNNYKSFCITQLFNRG